MGEKLDKMKRAAKEKPQPKTPEPVPAVAPPPEPVALTPPAADPKPAPKGPRPPTSKAMRLDNVMQTKGRLPNGSRFSLEYDAEAVRWSGTLGFGGDGGEPVVFTDDSKAVFKLLTKLDNQYREWAAKRQTATVALTPPAEPIPDAPEEKK